MKDNRKNIIAVIVIVAVAICIMGGYAIADELSNNVPSELTHIAQLTVYVDGELSDQSRGNAVCGDVITLRAPLIDGKTFSYWAFDSEDGSVASTRETYMFTFNSDTVLYAVYGSKSQDSPAVAFSSITGESALDGEYINIVASYSLRESDKANEPQLVKAEGEDALDEANNQRYELSEAQMTGEVGIRYTTGPMLGYDGELPENFDIESLLKTKEQEKGVHVSSGTVSFTEGDWTLRLDNPGTILYAVAYVDYGDDTIYSDVKAIDYSTLGSSGMLVSNIDEPFSYDENGDNNAEGGE